MSGRWWVVVVFVVWGLAPFAVVLGSVAGWIGSLRRTRPDADADAVSLEETEAAEVDVFLAHLFPPEPTPPHLSRGGESE